MSKEQAIVISQSTSTASGPYVSQLLPPTAKRGKFDHEDLMDSDEEEIEKDEFEQYLAFKFIKSKLYKY
jgi:hypothetical protein